MSFSLAKPQSQLSMPDLMNVMANAIMEMPRAEAPLTHRFTPGLYGREVKLPKGTLNISKIHKRKHQFIISQGHVEVFNRATGETVHYVAPYHGITEPGTQRAVYAHEDSTWTTFHPTDLTDPEEIENEIIQKPDENSITVSDEKIQQLAVERLK